MAYVITEPCVGTKDGSCQLACPVGCIVDVGEHLAVDPDRCVDCGACVSACPVSAIFPVARVPTEWAGWIERNRRSTRGGLVTGSTPLQRGAPALGTGVEGTAHDS